MGLFSLTQELAIDLGTANTIIINNGKIVVDEPSIVALDQHSGKLVAIGKQARQMHGKTHQNIRTIRPLKDGVIADFNAAELMLRGLIKMVKSSGRLFSPSLKMVISIPSGSTNVEIRAVRDSAEHAGGREVYMIYEPMAAALGAGLDVEAPEGHMVVDIGGGTTEIACISLGGIVCSESINVAGDVFTEDIQTYIRQQHNMRIGERTAEDIKIAVGAALSELDEEPEDFEVTGPNILTSLPSVLSISYSEMAYALEKSLVKIDAAIMKVLEMIPPELYADIAKKGVYLAGGGALLKGLDVSVMEEIAQQLPITEGLERMMTILKRVGYKTAILSGGFTYFGNYLRQRFGFDYVYANELEIVDGRLTGRYAGEIVDGRRKAELLRLLCQFENINIAQSIAVGDGANDLPMLSLAGLGIAFHAKPKVKATAGQSISTIGLDGILYFLGLKDSWIER